MIKIVIADSHDDFRNGVKNLLSTQPDFDVVGVGKDGCEALSLLEEFKPDIALLELELPLLNAIRMCPSLKIRSPHTAVIVLAETKDDKTLLEIISNGISGCLLRSSVLDGIGAAVREVHNDGFHMSRELTVRAMQLFMEFMQEKQEGKLPARQKKAAPLLIGKVEIQIAASIGEGWSNKQIAERMKFKEGTVRNYISTILRKTGLEHRTQIAIYALNNGFTERDAINTRGAKACKRQRGSSAPRARSRRDPAQLEFQYDK